MGHNENAKSVIKFSVYILPFILAGLVGYQFVEPVTWAKVTAQIIIWSFCGLSTLILLVTLHADQDLRAKLYKKPDTKWYMWIFKLLLFASYLAVVVHGWIITTLAIAWMVVANLLSKYLRKKAKQNLEQV